MKNKLPAQSLKRPKWWLLSLVMPLMAGMLVVENRFKLSAAAHQIVGIGIILFVYGLMAVWLWINSDYFVSQPASYFIADHSKPVLVYTFNEMGETSVQAIDEMGRLIFEMEDEPLSEGLHKGADNDANELIQAIEAALLLEYEKLYLPNKSG